MSARQMALEALRNLTDKANVAAFPFTRGDVTKADEAIATLEAEIAQVVEPVAQVDSWTSGSYWRNYKLTWLQDVPKGALLYAAPQQAAINAELLEALRFYANHEVYKPDPMGRVGDLTYVARAAIAKVGGAA